MVTYFLGEAEVESYLRDLLSRLRSMNPAPEIFCPITDSGEVIIERLFKIATPEEKEWLSNVPIASVDVGGDEVFFTPASDLPQFTGKHVFLFDGAVHSGKMMSLAITALQGKGAAAICSYTLILKRGSTIIPTFWGLMIRDTDRAFYLLDSIPNNRLKASRPKYPQAYANLRALNALLAKELPALETGVASIDRVRWSDRHFDMVSSDGAKTTYLLEMGGGISGFISLNESDTGSLWIDEVGVSMKSQKFGCGGILMRFAETIARQTNCTHLRLYAICEQVEWYKGFEFTEVPGAKSLRLDEETYIPMERVILHHQLRVNE